MNDPDPYADDPFFKFIPDGDWNACIGRQGEEENYIDGYIEASIQLVEAIFEKNLLGHRDTLILPILYNARHGIELALKYCAFRLEVAGCIQQGILRRNHDISAYEKILHDAKIGDEKLKSLLNALHPFVESLARIDSDGQELRYHENRDNGASLQRYSVANLRLIRESLQTLREVVSGLTYRVVDYISERGTGTCTDDCSRSDLLAIARLLPKRDKWDSQDFSDAREHIRKRFGLSSGAFTRHLDLIQRNREMRAAIGLETDLSFLTDETIASVAEEWRRIHPRRTAESRSLRTSFRFDLKDILTDRSNQREIVDGLVGRLSLDELAELQALFYLGRDPYFTEFYEDAVRRCRRQPELISNPSGYLSRILDKTNLLTCLQRSTHRLGRLALATRLSDI
ncbi:DUF3775 domain-containing protein [Rhizobium leguminosarum]|uniref:DUF3775 domain-containing protein n=1 Tax=Rhizobium leguminosarum TaxID=384 RepID=UPI0010307813|nr:DUF3775 domain-containing protein [Rhizobium leguminosarum]TBE93120.1 DUF3775 domain-containing protein [Rhizobium leguminosarum]